MSRPVISLGLFGIFSSGTNLAMFISELRTFAGTCKSDPGRGRGYRRLVAMRQDDGSAGGDKTPKFET
jgi:hypothetical protein